MDILTTSERSVRMGLIRSRDTGPEIAVRSLVHGMGYRYRLHGKDLPGRPDLVFKVRRKVIFVHGCFWHLHRNCSNCRPPKSRREYWKPKLERNAARDKQVRQRLRRLGWRSLVLWECELANCARLAQKISVFLGED
jgi:DNA mismatch endonuclease (patch repair protein)